jgi:4-phospho-D-threonate 3-dehydrogenase / 4-phospho-D-erythronate 3-dehydrogenase
MTLWSMSRITKSTPRLMPIIGITIGEPAGIGPEVIRKALHSGKLPKGFRYEVIGNGTGVLPGRMTRKSAKLALGALEEAALRWQRGQLAAIVTGPVSKENLSRVGFTHPGQTEFLADRCGPEAGEPVMMLTDRRLTVALVSTHCSLREAVRRLSVTKYVRVARELSHFFQGLGVKKPRVALAGVNPHAGEGGLFGNEEARFVVPAVRQLQAEGIDASGPHSPDTVFHRAVKGEFEGVVCAYHDQGLIPFKLLAFRTGVNVTLGLPMIRTSPDHGTALDLAGTGKADETSMVEAIRLACRLVRAKKHL